MDSESEKVVQQALDNIMLDKSLITVVIAHRLSTIRGADKIAFVDHGKVREIGTYDELMAKPNGHYKRLEALQTLESNDDNRSEILAVKKDYKKKKDEKKDDEDKKEEKVDQAEIDAERMKEYEKRAKELAKDEYHLFAIGTVGAILHGLM